MAKGVPPIKLVDDDGGGHESFQQALASATEGRLARGRFPACRTVSAMSAVRRPWAPVPREIVLDDSGRTEAVRAPTDGAGLRRLLR